MQGKTTIAAGNCFLKQRSKVYFKHQGSWVGFSKEVIDVKRIFITMVTPLLAGRRDGEQVWINCGSECITTGVLLNKSVVLGIFGDKSNWMGEVLVRHTDLDIDLAFKLWVRMHKCQNTTLRKKLRLVVSCITDSCKNDAKLLQSYQFISYQFNGTHQQ